MTKNLATLSASTFYIFPSSIFCDDNADLGTINTPKISDWFIKHKEGISGLYYVGIQM